jgi:hypothetical protein
MERDLDFVIDMPFYTPNNIKTRYNTLPMTVKRK